MMFGMTNFDIKLENATSHLRLEPDWPSILLICDEIRQNDVTPKVALAGIKKKMNSPNPHTAAYALIVLESIVKNCGSPVHDEICTKENCEMFTSFIETTPHEKVKAKMLELIQAWAFAFRTNDKYQAIKDTMTILKTKGHAFPELAEADAMFTSDTAPGWSDGKVCHRCRDQFSFTNRKHHCRNCGQIFCAQCSSRTCRLPKYGIEKEVRVCEGCYMTLHPPNSTAVGSSSRGGSTSETDLPAEYLASSLAQQSQSPPRKTEQELKEEEELQLALALSQSEAEQKNRLSTTSYRPIRKSPSPEAPVPITTATYAAPITPAASLDDTQSDPELAKYLNRDYWEQRKTLESPASPSAPSPMSQTSSIMPLKNGPEDYEIDEFSSNMRTQVEIFVNRMKSNSSRGRNIVTDSAVQTLFMTLTSFHSRLLTYIKEMDDKRMWYEQLQDKLAQVKDSRAALDVLRQEHQDKLRLIAEEHERQRQMQMAHKLEIMRKKKQEYLQYQRQLALQRLQEQEREMQMRQEQQKALYQMGGNNYSFMSAGVAGPQPQGSPLHQMAGGYGPQYGYNPMGQRFGPPPPPHDMYQAGMGMQATQGIMNIPPGHLPGIVSQQAHNIGIPNQYIGGQPLIQGQPPGPGLDGQQQQQQQQHLSSGQINPNALPGMPPNSMMQQHPGIHNQGMPVTSNGSSLQQTPQQGMPPQTQGLPPQQQGMHPQQGMPPQQQGIPPQQQGMPTQQQGMPQPQHQGMPQPQHQGMPPQHQGMPPQQGIPPQQQGIPPQQQGLPQQQLPPVTGNQQPQVLHQQQNTISTSAQPAAAVTAPPIVSNPPQQVAAEPTKAVAPPEAELISFD